MHATVLWLFRRSVLSKNSSGSSDPSEFDLLHSFQNDVWEPLVSAILEALDEMLKEPTPAVYSRGRVRIIMQVSRGNHKKQADRAI